MAGCKLETPPVRAHLERQIRRHCFARLFKWTNLPANSSDSVMLLPRSTADIMRRTLDSRDFSTTLADLLMLLFRADQVRQYGHLWGLDRMMCGRRWRT